MMRKILGGAVLVLAGMSSACGSSDGSSGIGSEGAGAVGEVHFAVNGLTGDLAVIAIQNVFDRDQNWLIECARKDHTLGEDGPAFCDELTVLPPGVYEVIVQSPDPNCESEQDHYKVVVEPGQTTEITVNLICGQDNGALDVIVEEDNRPVIEDVTFLLATFNGFVPGNKFICQDDDDGQYNYIAVTITDADWADPENPTAAECEAMSALWSAPADLHLIPNDTFGGPDTLLFDIDDDGVLECIATAAVDNNAAVVGDYEVTVTISDEPVAADDETTTSLTFPVHILPDCDPVDGD